MTEREQPVGKPVPAPAGIHPLRDLLLAVGFLTALPVGRTWPDDGETDMVGYFPWVGALLGLVAAGLSRALHVVAGSDPLRALLGGALVVATWAALTRFLHWDGLADTADGLGCRDPRRRLEVMCDSTIGAFGAAAIALVALVQVAAAAVLVASDAWVVLLLAPVVGRLVAVSTSWSVTPARATGLGALVSGRPRAAALVPTLFAAASTLVLAWWRYPRLGVVVVLAGWLLGLAAARHISRQVGGLTGDILGALVLLTETATLVAAALLL